MTEAQQAEIHYGAAQGVRLVAGREITTRLRSKAYKVFTGVMMGIVIVAVIVINVINSVSSGPDATIGVTQQTAGLSSVVTTAAKGAGQTVATKRVASVADGEKQVTAGDLDGLLVGDGSTVHVVVKKDIDGKLRAALDAAASHQALDREIDRLKGDPDAVTARVAKATAQVQPLEPPYPYNLANVVLGALAGVLIYMTVLMNGQTIAQGVVEEKSSRVVELLLATVKPWQIMFGKVLGIGVVGFIQMVLIVAAGVIPAAATGLLPSISGSVVTAIWAVVWFVLGFLAYAFIFAGLGALVSRQEDIGGATALPLMLLMAGYIVGISTIWSNPGSKLIEVMSIIPTFSPTLMPMRLGAGGVPTWEIILSLVLTLIFIPALLWLSARIYRNAIVRTGTKVKFRDALKAA